MILTLKRIKMMQEDTNNKLDFISRLSPTDLITFNKLIKLLWKNKFFNEFKLHYHKAIERTSIKAGTEPKVCLMFLNMIDAKRFNIATIELPINGKFKVRCWGNDVVVNNRLSILCGIQLTLENHLKLQTSNNLTNQPNSAPEIMLMIYHSIQLFREQQFNK